MAASNDSPTCGPGRFCRLSALVLLLAALGAGCARAPVPPPGGYGRSYEVYGRRYWTLNKADGYVERGLASWYGRDFHGRRTSSGERYDMYALTAAHKTLPLDTWVRVFNLRNGREAVVRKHDRGPFVDGRIIDLSLAGARALGMEDDGVVPVRVEALGYRQPSGGYSRPSSYDTGEFTIQVGAFRDPANARRLCERLKGLGEARTYLFERDGETFYRVRVARYGSLAEALQRQAEMRRRGFADAFVVAAD